MTDHPDYDKVRALVLKHTSGQFCVPLIADILDYGDERFEQGVWSASRDDDSYNDGYAACVDEGHEEWVAMRAVCDAAAAIKETWPPALRTDQRMRDLLAAVEAWQATQEDR